MAPTAPSPTRAAPFWRHAAACAGLVMACEASVASAAERPVRVTIQAQPRFEQAITRFSAGDGIELGAELVGDTGEAIASAEVGVALTSGERGLRVSPCDSAASGRAGARGALLRTDASGRICARIAGSDLQGSVRLDFAGDGDHLPASVTIDLQPAPTTPTLAFDAPSLELDLDQPSLRLRLALSAAEAEGVPSIELELHDGGRTIPLATSEWSRSGETLSFSLDTRELGAPGPARLVARRAGDGSSARAEAIALRVATVDVAAEVLSDDGGNAEVRVWTRTRSGVAPSGWVEATRAGEEAAVGSAPFVEGSARLALETSDAASEVLLHYRSDDPWWLPGEPLRLSLGARTPRAPRRWPWLALLAPIGYVCLRSLQRPAQRKAEKRPLPKPRPAALVVESAVPRSGWAGYVTDAHDGQPIAGARVQALLPSFRGVEPNALISVADARGWFELPALQHPLPEGARLRVWAPLHSDVERPLPPQGRVSIALTSRRRAVLRRLVRWARSIGAPWVRGTEPTPGEIADIAARRGDPLTARWAESVQEAAFGDAPVDETVEAALRAGEPSWRQTPTRDSHDD